MHIVQIRVCSIRREWMRELRHRCRRVLRRRCRMVLGCKCRRDLWLRLYSLV